MLLQFTQKFLIIGSVGRNPQWYINGGGNEAARGESRNVLISGRAGITLDEDQPSVEHPDQGPMNIHPSVILLVIYRPMGNN